jgi:hypothetical protein
MIVFPTVLSLGVCRGHLDLDNRGVRLEEYDAEVKSSPSLARNISCGGIIGVCIVVSEV